MTIRNQIVAHGRTLMLLGAMAGAAQALMFATPAFAIQEDEFPTCRVALEGTGFRPLVGTRDHTAQCCFVLSEKRWYNDHEVFVSAVYSVSDDETMLTTHCSRIPLVTQSLISTSGDGDGGGDPDDTPPSTAPDLR
ncbi:MAG: hypothetical protein JWQ89_4075 [Devosia sp.]|uniref:hypothetical protein n=1 Tax=Devosia sp. TaxID=1871048 RepID=UPI002607F28D|nr:hypothetical protein [Devosia sp.]MDB5542348.1 hypothetical protein [Devosia sp.]